MADIKCACGKCGAKYRLPAEFAGRTARCKKCSEKFEVPRERSLEDSVLDWLAETDPSDADALEQPRVISIPKAASGDANAKSKGPIRLKTGGGGPAGH